jgi:hypothetical protein
MRSVPVTGLLFTVIVFALGCDGGITQSPDRPDQPAFAVDSNVVTREVSGTATNDCTGEVLAATARSHELAAVTEDAAGGVHVKIHSQVHLTATSELTGAQYSGSGIINQTVFDRGDGHVETFQLTFTLIGHGSVPNEVATILFHVRVLPDGTVTSTIDTFRIHCQ